MNGVCQGLQSPFCQYRRVGRHVKLYKHLSTNEQTDGEMYTDCIHCKKWFRYPFTNKWSLCQGLQSLVETTNTSSPERPRSPPQIRTFSVTTTNYGNMSIKRHSEEWAGM